MRIQALVSYAILFLFFSHNVTAQYVITDSLSRGTLGNNQFLAAGDIDGDGDVDIITPSGWLSNEEPIFSWHAGWDESYTFDSMLVGDIDQDGDLDLIAEEATGFFIVRNDGMGGFEIQFTTASAVSVEGIGDADGDGDLDLFFVGNDPVQEIPQFFWLENMDGAFQVEHWLGIGGQDGLDVVDLDGDGDSDLGYFDGEVYNVLIQDAVGFQLTASIDYASTPDLNVDFDGDSHIDLLRWGYFSELQTYGLSIRLNDGSGNFALPEYWTHDGSAFAGKHFLRDFSGDGKPDLVLYDATEFRYYANNGDDGFNRKPYELIHEFADFMDFLFAVQIEQDGPYQLLYSKNRLNVLLDLETGDDDFLSIYIQGVSENMMATDYDDDGDDDIFVIFQQDGLILFENNNPGFAAARPLLSGNISDILFAADLNNDGVQEYFLQSDSETQQDTLKSYVVDTSGNLTIDRVHASVLYGDDFSVVDLNQDGYSDLLFRQSGHDALTFSLNDSTGGLLPRTEVSLDVPPLVDVPYYRSRPVDWDGDGDVDIAYNPTSEECICLAVALNDGEANFNEMIHIPSPTVNFFQFLDTDDNGSPEVININYNQNTLDIYEISNNGLDSVMSYSSEYFPGELSLLDLDLDGDLDLLFPPQVLLNDGDNNYDVYPLPTTAARSYAVLDVQQDAKPEIVMSTWITSFIVIYEWSGVLPTSTQESPTSNMKLIPNPTSNSFAVDWDTRSSGPIQIRLYDHLGQLARVYQYDPGQFYDCSDLPVGLYVVEVLQGQERLEMQKLLVTR